MSDALHVATRKGLFTFRRDGGGWTAGPPAFLGEPVTAVLTDPRDGAVYAALRLGHFGCKLHRSDDGGASWQELPAPAYPPAPRGRGRGAGARHDLDARRRRAGRAGRDLGRARCRAGSSSAATAARAGRWSRRSGSRPERAEWFGGGYDHPGIHSILVDPRDPRRLTVGVSCGGVWKSDDRGASWRLAGQGLRAAFMPPERAYDPNIQDPHLVAACAADAGRGLVPAPQRHVPLRPTAARPSPRSTRRRPRASASPWRAHPRRPADRLVRAGGQGRVPGAGGRPAGGHPHPRRRRELRDAGRRAAGGGELGPRLSPRAGGGRAAARGSPWARPPATSGSATAAARAGRRSTATCRRSPRWRSA